MSQINKYGIGTFKKDVESNNPLITINVICRDFVEVLENSVHDNIIRHAKVIMKELSKFSSVHF